MSKCQAVRLMPYPLRIGIRDLCIRGNGRMSAQIGQVSIGSANSPTESTEMEGGGEGMIIMGFDYEGRRLSFKPDRVNVLLVGEARPSKGNFFYRYEMDDWFRHCTEEVFAWVYPEQQKLFGKPFLEFFRAQGFYLEDLSQEPVDKSNREALCAAGVERLAAKIAEWKPDAVISVVKQANRYVKNAISQSGFSPRLHEAIPYPGRRYPRHVESFKQELTRVLQGMRAEGRL